MVRRRGTPSTTWRSFLRNQAAGIVAIDMFVVASASFRLQYVMIILAHDRRKIVRLCHAASDRRLAIVSGNRSLPVGHCSALSAARSRRLVWPALPQASRCDGNHSSRHGATFTLAERIRRARHRFASSRMSGSHRDLQRAASAPRPLNIYRLLPPNAHASFTRQGLPGPSPDHARQKREGRRHPASQWLA
jgi:hypothetical protein